MSYTDLTRDTKEAVVTIRNLHEAEKALRPYIPLVRELTGKHTVLDRIRPLMESLGNPQDELKIIHIAGTSGKTSTAYYMAALLKEAGQNVGLTVSPHIDSITERIQINGRPMPEKDFCRELSTFLELVQKTGLKPSYFELLYAFVIWVLSRRNIDYAVVETGLGGLQDATNVAGRPDKVCVMTDIDFDHMGVLGKTLSEIAAQKVGIVHDHNHVFMYRQGKEVMKVVQDWINDHQAPLHTVKEEQGDNGLPSYQRRNWNLAYQVYAYLQKRDNLPSLTSQALAKTQKIQIPGRMEIKHVKGKTVIMDGAHNAQKMGAFIDSFKKLYPGVRPAVLLALKTGKEYEKVVPLLAPFAARTIVTSFDTIQDLPIKSMGPARLAQSFQDAGCDVEVVMDPKTAFSALLDGPEEVCVVTGSFYLLGEVRNNKNP